MAFNCLNLFGGIGLVYEGMRYVAPVILCSVEVYSYLSNGNNFLSQILLSCKKTKTFSICWLGAKLHAHFFSSKVCKPEIEQSMWMCVPLQCIQGKRLDLWSPFGDPATPSRPPWQGSSLETCRPHIPRQIPGLDFYTFSPVTTETETVIEYFALEM